MKTTTSMNIDPKYLKLIELLSNRLFEIPEYQRAYSWGTKQREDLFADIRKSYKTQNGNDHFMATEVTKWVKSVTEAVDELNADQRRNAVTKIAQARLVAVAVNLRSDLTTEDRNKILRRWENVTFRIYGMCGKDARTKVVEYTRLAWQIVKTASLSDLTPYFRYNGN